MNNRIRPANSLIANIRIGHRATDDLNAQPLQFGVVTPRDASNQVPSRHQRSADRRPQESAVASDQYADTQDAVPFVAIPTNSVTIQTPIATSLTSIPASRSRGRTHEAFERLHVAPRARARATRNRTPPPTSSTKPSQPQFPAPMPPPGTLAPKQVTASAPIIPESQIPKQQALQTSAGRATPRDPAGNTNESAPNVSSADAGQATGMRPRRFQSVAWLTPQSRTLAHFP